MLIDQGNGQPLNEAKLAQLIVGDRPSASRCDIFAATQAQLTDFAECGLFGQRIWLGQREGKCGGGSEEVGLRGRSISHPHPPLISASALVSPPLLLDHMQSKNFSS